MHEATSTKFNVCRSKMRREVHIEVGFSITPKECRDALFLAVYTFCTVYCFDPGWLKHKACLFLNHMCQLLGTLISGSPHAYKEPTTCVSGKFTPYCIPVHIYAAHELNKFTRMNKQKYSMIKKPKVFTAAAVVALIVVLLGYPFWFFPACGPISGSVFSAAKIRSLPENASLRDQLAYYYPYEPERPFNRDIWQTWKTDAFHADFPKHLSKYEKGWGVQNPGFNHIVIPDSRAHELVRELFKQMPRLLEAYELLPQSILRVDFFRYLILFAKGGTYSDIDTVALKPIQSWVSFNKTIYGEPNNAGLVVGVEADGEDSLNSFSRRVQLCQWTIQAKKGHPMLRELIVRIVEITMDKAERGALDKVEGRDSGDTVINWTGPGVFTDAVFDYMNYIYSDGRSGEGLGMGTFKPKMANPNANGRVPERAKQALSWFSFTRLEKPKVIKDVLILPITSFSPGRGWKSKDDDDDIAYAKHMFAGSWKDQK